MLDVYDMFNEFRRLQREMNRLFDGVDFEAEAFPAVNIWGNADGLVVTAEIPGVDPKTLNVSVNQDMLTIEGERKRPELQEGVVCHRAERAEGRFLRTVRLPFAAAADKAKAQYKLGVLTLEMPREESTKPKKIAITAG